MSTLADILTFVINTLGGVFLLFVVLRFFLQLARADFYNPFSQAVVKVTNPLLIPIRRVIPGLFGIDVAAIVLALAVQIIITETVSLILFQTLIDPISVFIWAVLGTLKLTTWVMFVCILVMVVVSFVAPHSHHPLILLVHQIVSPLTRPVQKFIPPMGGLDFSVFFIGMGIVIVQKILDGFASAASLAPMLVIGY